MARLARRRAAHQAAVLGCDFDIIAAATLPLISEGIYEGIGGHAHRPRRVFNTLKLYVPFTVLVPNTTAPNGLDRVLLVRHFNVHSAPDRRFQVRPTSNYWREWVLAAGRRPSRHDRMSPRVFEGVLFAVEVRTVKRDREQHELPPHTTYSVIARIIERKAGGYQP